MVLALGLLASACPADSGPGDAARPASEAGLIEQALVGDWTRSASSALALRFAADGTMLAASSVDAFASSSLWSAAWSIDTTGRLVLIALAGLCAPSSGPAPALALYNITVDTMQLTLSAADESCATRLVLLPGTFVRAP